ncbi:arginine--tRNA ligase [Bdellovibrionota bacterium FG-2]
MVQSYLKAQAEILLTQGLKTSFNLDDTALTPLLGLLTYPPNTELGHVAFPCHSLSKILRRAPQQIAAQLTAQILKTDLFPKIEAAAGYVNFVSDLSHLTAVQLTKLKNGPFLPPIPVDAKKVIIEYSQLNTHKAYHVGHLRNIVFGDCIARIVEASGNPVVRAIYPGDMGTHIAKVLWYIQRFKATEIPDKDLAEWLGNMYGEADAFLKSQANTPDEATFKAEMGTILHELEQGGGSFFPLYQKTREASLSLMREILNWLGIEFDVWYFESECNTPSREIVLKNFEEGKLIKSDGAIGADLSAFGLGFAMFLKSNGTTLYLTKDLELLKRKFENPEVMLSILVVDVRQTLHFKQLFKTAELIGLRSADDSLHLSYETVTDEKGEPCSSRGRTGFRLEVLARMMEQTIKERYLNVHQGDWAQSEIDATARDIALGALKYGFLKVDSNRIIRFVLDEWIQLEGDTGPYLQYVHARCRGVLQKVPMDPEDTPLEFATPFDHELALMIERFTDAVASARKEYRPSVLCSYLFDLSKTFNRFYKECPIKTASSNAQKNTRLKLVELTAATLKEGLAILGIPSPNRL